jgi:TPR repeat protein
MGPGAGLVAKLGVAALMIAANLGLYYANGWGGPKDAAQARNLWEKAAAAGNDQAKEALKKLNGKK